MTCIQYVPPTPKPKKSADGCTTYHCDAKPFFDIHDEEEDEVTAKWNLDVVPEPVVENTTLRDMFWGVGHHTSFQAQTPPETKQPEPAKQLYTVTRCDVWGCECGGHGFCVSALERPGKDVHYNPHCACRTKTHSIATFSSCVAHPDKKNPLPFLKNHEYVAQFWACTVPNCRCEGLGMISTTEFGFATTKSWRIHLWATREEWVAEPLETVAVGAVEVVVSDSLAKNSVSKQKRRKRARGAASTSTSTSAPTSPEPTTTTETCSASTSPVSTE